MTAASGRVFSAKPFGGDDSVIPWALKAPLAAAVAPFRHWLMGYDSSGNLVAQAAGVTDIVSAGFADRDQASSATAAAAAMLMRQQFVSGYANGTSTDAIGAGDMAIAAWATDNTTVGKLSNSGGVNRALLGIALGLDEDNALPLVYPGPIGWLLGRAAHTSDNFIAASYQFIVDAAASTATAETVMSRAPVHGKITEIAFLPSAALTADNTNNAVITISKRDGAGGGAVTLATLTTNVAGGSWTAFQKKTLTLSVVAGALNLLETDLVTITVTKGGTGVAIPASAVRIAMKVG